MPPPLQLFHTCLVNEFAPDVGLAAARVLERCGFEVQVPIDQTCCGQPAFNAGFQDQARAAARHTIVVFEATSGPIVIPSGSCGDMLIHQYPALLDQDAPWHARAEAVASRCHEFSAFVAAHPPSPLSPPPGASPTSRAAAATSVAYHPSCHLLRGLGVDEAPRSLIAATPGARLVDVDAQDDCCGFGGLFSIKHPDISGRMLERKLDRLTASGADRLVSCDLGCLLHLGGGLHRRGSSIAVQHLAELLDESAS